MNWISGTPVKGDVLSGREKDIGRLLVQGMTNSQIGSALYLSKNTVKSHLRRIFEKLDVNNRTAAAAVLLQKGLLE